jgi:hypothetical protein
MNPLIFLGAVLAKKGVAVFLYRYASDYGFPRIYKKLVIANNQITSSRETRRLVQTQLKAAFRAPNRAMDLLQSSEVFELARYIYGKIPRFIQILLPKPTDLNAVTKLLQEIIKLTAKK